MESGKTQYVRLCPNRIQTSTFRLNNYYHYPKPLSLHCQCKRVQFCCSKSDKSDSSAEHGCVQGTVGKVERAWQHLTRETTPCRDGGSYLRFGQGASWGFRIMVFNQRGTFHDRVQQLLSPSGIRASMFFVRCGRWHDTAGVTLPSSSCDLPGARFPTPDLPLAVKQLSPRGETN